jgi:hypothetical protein
VLSTLITKAQSDWGTVAGDILGLASMAKVPECLGLLVHRLSAPSALRATVDNP